MRRSVRDTGKRVCGSSGIGRVEKENLTVDTATFITHVLTVILVVALAAAMDASAVTTFKFVRAASGTC